MAYTHADVIKKYLELRDAKAILEAKQKNEVKPYKEALDKLEAYIANEFNAQGVDSIKTEFGTAYRSKVMSVKMTGRDEFIEYAVQNDEDMLDIRASKSGVQRYLEQHEGVTVPGIELNYLYNVNVRKK